MGDITKRGQGRGKKRYKRSKGGKLEIKIGYINMQGGRREDKWKELMEVCMRDDINILGVTETHLRDTEEPHLGMGKWIGINREGGEKRGGGVGLWIKENEIIEIMECKKCKEHVWVIIKGDERKKMVIGVVYMAINGNKNVEQNINIYDCMSEDVKELRGRGAKVILMGDFNGHIEELGNEENVNGRLMKEFCFKNDLLIGNLMMCFRGEYTWSRGNQKTAIDYFLIGRECNEEVKEIKIYDEEEKGCESDHNMMTLSMGNNRNINNKRETGKYREGWNIKKKNGLVEFGYMLNKSMSKEGSIKYENFMEMIKEAADEKLGQESRGKGGRGYRNDEEIKRVIKDRKKANREYKMSLKNKEGNEIVEEKWRIYINKRKVARIKIAEKERLKDRKLMKIIKEGGKESSKKFWDYIKSRREGNNEEYKELEGEEGIVSDKKEIKKVLDKFVVGIMRKQRNKDNTTGGVEQKKLETEGGNEKLKIDENCFNRILDGMKDGKARGTDGIAIEMIKMLDKRGRIILKNCFENIMNSKDFPKEWKETRVRLIHKGKGKDKKRLENYRPIAITSVLYKIFTYIMKEWIVQWIEDNHILGELQHGFRKDRNIGDCLFIITQLMERSIRENTGMVIGFLDVEKAYDMVDRDLLWEILKNKGMGYEWIEILKGIYRGNKYIYQWGEINSDRVISERGLRQGCPMSAVLFTLYIDSLDRDLMGSGLGMQLRGTSNRIPGILFADDVLLCTENRKDMQELLNICEKKGRELKLSFGVDKSKVMWVNKREEGIWKLGGIEIEEVEKYEYLGIVLKEGKDYLNEWENKIRSRANRNKGIIKKVACMSFNRYEVVRLLWKCVAVPGITYGNEVLVTSSNMGESLELMQREMGRFALGGNLFTAVEAIQGDMGWSSFKDRESKAKLKRFGRMQMMDNNRVSKWVFRDGMLRSSKSKWWKRVIQIAGIFDKDRISYYLGLWEGEMGVVVGNMRIEEWNKQIEDRIKKESEKIWYEGISKKKTLEIYKNKKGIREEGDLYENGRGSELFFQARAGSLKTKQRMKKIGNLESTICDLCGEGEEDITHVLLICNSLKHSRERVKEMGGGDFENKNEFIDLCKKWLGFGERGVWLGWVKSLLMEWELKKRNGNVE